MGRFQQGTVVYKAPSETAGDPWNPVTGTAHEYTLNATVRGVGDMYRDSTLIQESDLLVTAAVFGVQPVTSGKLVIDGRQHEIVSIEQTPAAGIAITWRFVARA